MNRRDFLATVGSMALVPVLPNFLVAAPKPVHWTLLCPLRIREIPWPDDWHIRDTKIEISKGPYKVSFAGCGPGDLHDCHGLCATDEMVQMLVDQLEIGDEGLRHLYSTWEWSDYSDEGNSRRMQLIENYRWFRLTYEEKSQIWACINKNRGEHDCVHKHHKTRSKYEPRS